MISTSLLDVMVFNAVGVLTETQQVSLAAAQAMPSSDQEKVFAETLCLVAAASAGSAAGAFAESPEVAAAVKESLLDCPMTLHSYVAGSEVLTTGADSADSVPDQTPQLARMLVFYQAHLPGDGLPDRISLQKVMVLWMGRISPPGLDEHPEERLNRLGLVEKLYVHLRLVEAYSRNAAEAMQAAS